MSKRPTILRFGGLFGAHPRLTRTSERRSGSVWSLLSKLAGAI